MEVRVRNYEKGRFYISKELTLEDWKKVFPNIKSIDDIEIVDWINRIDELEAKIETLVDELLSAEEDEDVRISELESDLEDSECLVEEFIEKVDELNSEVQKLNEENDNLLAVIKDLRDKL